MNIFKRRTDGYIHCKKCNSINLSKMWVDSIPNLIFAGMGEPIYIAQFTCNDCGFKWRNDNYVVGLRTRIKKELEIFYAESIRELSLSKVFEL